MPENHSKVGKRCDSYTLENAHPEEYHFEDGRPVFLKYHIESPSGKGAGKWVQKHIHKVVTFYTTPCPECGEPCYHDDDGEQSCGEQCGGFIDHAPLDYSVESAGRYGV